jgi:hypothetical protein
MFVTEWDRLLTDNVSFGEIVGAECGCQQPARHTQEENRGENRDPRDGVRAAMEELGHHPLHLG